jgi:uncharacterized membrane protein YidH (DUF202 family)
VNSVWPYRENDTLVTVIINEYQKKYPGNDIETVERREKYCREDSEIFEKNRIHTLKDWNSLSRESRDMLVSKAAYPVAIPLRELLDRICGDIFGDSSATNNLLKEATTRDKMAAERTFLAWMRTSLSIIAIGVAALKLVQINHIPALVRVVGCFFISSGIIPLLYMCLRSIYTSFFLKNSSSQINFFIQCYFLLFGLFATVLSIFIVFY